jgi:hypothetical protein
MRDRLPANHNELRAWVLSELTVRTSFEAPSSTTKASKMWLAGWATIILAVTIGLSIAAVPPPAYAIPLVVAFAITRSKVHLEVGTRRSQGIQRRTTDNSSLLR